MTEAEVIRQMRAHLESLFPKRCPKCGRTYDSLREYLQNTTPMGPAIPYDVELGDWQPQEPLGLATYANCRCGNTMGMTSHGMPLVQLWRLLRWAQTETKRRRLTPQELLNYLRDEISQQVLAEPAAGDAGK